MKHKLNNFFTQCRKSFINTFKNKSREFYSGLISFIVLILSVYWLIMVFVSFENQEYSESENVFFTGIILEPTIFNDYRDNIESLSYDSISLERRKSIELYTNNAAESRLDSIANYLKSYRYNHNNIEDEIISVESNYSVSDTGIVYKATFRLNEYINEKNKSDFVRKIKVVLRTPHNKEGNLNTIYTNNDLKIKSPKIAKTVDFVSAFQLFEIENKESMPESKRINDEYKIYDLTITQFPFTIEFTLKNIPSKSYFDDYELELVNIIDSKEKQNFTVKNNIEYSNNIEILNINPIENILNENNINNDITLQNLPYKNITIDNQKLSEDIWTDVDRFTFPVDQNRTEIYLKYRNTKKELQKELVSVVLSILIGAALSVFLTIFLGSKPK